MIQNFVGAYLKPLILIFFSCLGIVTIHTSLMQMCMDTQMVLYIGLVITES